jgi:hypothetical protein
MAFRLFGGAVSAGGAAFQGAQQANALNNNATVMGYEGTTAAAQGYQAEANLRRRTAMILGNEQAAAGQAGAGYGGSVGRSIKQSALNMELDALNVRYKSQLQKWGYNTQAGFLRTAADAAQSAGTLRAGAALLTGVGNYYGSGTGLG